MSAHENVTGQAGIDAVEAPFWAPPEAPLDMPHQVLERARPVPFLDRLWQALTPRARA
ncbi:hypothetical protein [Pararhodobacter sp.]|uniref:hypothetical protein n=1 Tax=Pararhodobacter TaxID=1097465 RepID=UPI002AFEC08E|nr:hypothetical protein [Pararhodobacter sp.]